MKENKRMMGVVLWSDTTDQKAVFWCEDHGDLAYYDASRCSGSEKELLNPGDMVEFDVFIERKIRHAQNARVVEAKVCNGLQDHLRNSAGRSAKAKERPFAANVVDLLPLQAQRRPA